MNKTLQESTKDALALITDPYHDYVLQITGFPDGTRTTTAKRRITARVPIVCPFVLGASETWTFHVYTTPLHYQTTLGNGTISSLVNIAAAGNIEIGPVNIAYVHYDAAGAVKASLITPLGEDSQSSNAGLCTRTVSLGFEIHDVTPELYKSGSVTVYRTNVHDEHIDMLIGASTQPTHYRYIANIPIDIDNANLLPNSRTWEAREGVYGVALPSPVNPYSSRYNQQVLLQGGVPGNAFYTPVPPLGVAANNASWSPLCPVGAMSSRFSTVQNTFMLDFRQTLEIAPDSDNRTILSFAGTAPEFDGSFIKMYTAMYNRIPAAVPVRFNDTGKWFSMILKVAKEILPSVVGALPPQIKPFALMAQPFANAAVDNLIKRIEKKKDKQKASQNADSNQRMVVRKKQ